MDDPTVVPWVLCWIGLVLAASGGVLAIKSVVRHRRPVAERIGLAVLAIGIVLMLAPPLLNGTALLAKACIDAHSQLTYKSPDQ